jgi:hypothetical protein
MQQRQANAANESTPIFIRFGVRLVILIVFAAVAQIGFARAFPWFLLLAGLFCSLWAILRCEPMFGPVLTHWDEAAALIVISRLAVLMT